MVVLLSKRDTEVAVALELAAAAVEVAAAAAGTGSQDSPLLVLETGWRRCTAQELDTELVAARNTEASCVRKASRKAKNSLQY